MKALKSINIYFLFLISATLFFSSCKKETCTNCELIINVKESGSNDFLEGALIKIATSNQNVRYGTILFEKDTDKNGEAKFDLKPGKYFYSIYYIFNNRDIYMVSELDVNNTGTNKYTVTLSE